MKAPIGSRGQGMLAVGVALIAAMVFAGGALAVFLSAPNGPQATPLAIGLGPTPRSTLQIYQNPTPTPLVTEAPIAPPIYNPTPSLVVNPGQGSPSPSLFPSFGFPTVAPTDDPTSGPTPQPTPRPTRPPRCDANGQPAGCRPTPAPTPPPTATPKPTPAPAQLKAGFTRSQVNGRLRVKFTDTSIGQPVRWLWDFGDDTTSTDRSPRHDYAEARDYQVTLTVWNAAGDSDSARRPTTVNPVVTAPPSTDPTPSPSPTPTPAPTMTALTSPPVSEESIEPTD